MIFAIQNLREAANSRRVLVSVPLALTAAVSFAAIYPRSAQAAPLRVVSARTILRRVDHGLPVQERNVEVRGALRLPASIAAPFVLRRSRIVGSIRGVSTTFNGVFDLSNTTVTGSLNLPYSEFHAPVLLRGTRVRGRLRLDFASFDEAVLMDNSVLSGESSFTGSVFRGPVRFTASTFAHGATFELAEFGDLGVFERTQFGGSTSFANAEFRSDADFGSAAFRGPSSFDRVRFFGGADYDGAYFTSGSAFDYARFEGDTTFGGTVFLRRASFASAVAGAQLDFGGAQFNDSVYFTRAQLEGADFSGGAKVGGTEFSGPVVFEEATVADLNLDGAAIDSTLRLPDPRGVGGIQDLRMDPGDVDRIQAVESSTASGNGGPRYGTRAAREAALALIETAARSGGDLAAADTAEVHRLTLERQDENFFLAALNWGVGWQIGGYLVRPLHPLVALVVLLFLVALARSWKARGTSDRTGPSGKLRGFRDDLRTGVSALWTFDPAGGGFLRLFEQVATKALVVAFVLSVGNVEPSLSPVVKGVLP